MQPCLGNPEWTLEKPRPAIRPTKEWSNHPTSACQFAEVDRALLHIFSSFPSKPTPGWQPDPEECRCRWRSSVPLKPTARPAILAIKPRCGLHTAPYRNPQAAASSPLELNSHNANGKLAVRVAPVLPACRLADGKKI